jgi:hypothetical protein
MPRLVILGGTSQGFFDAPSLLRRSGLLQNDRMIFASDATGGKKRSAGSGQAI